MSVAFYPDTNETLSKLAYNFLKNNKISKISFTGSSEIGKTIVKNSADKLAKVSLELGGKAPNIIFEDANLDSCIEANLRGGFFNQGENCTAVTRLFVHKKIFKKTWGFCVTHNQKNLILKRYKNKDKFFFSY